MINDLDVIIGDAKLSCLTINPRDDLFPGFLNIPFSQDFPPFFKVFCRNQEALPELYFG